MAKVKVYTDDAQEHPFEVGSEEARQMEDLPFSQSNVARVDVQED